MSRSKMTRKPALKRQVILNTNLRHPRTQNDNNADIISIGVHTVALDKLVSLGPT